MTTARFAASLLSLPIVLTSHVAAQAQDFERGARNTDFSPAFERQFRAPLVDSDVALERTVLTDEVARPWGIAVLPDDAGYLVTERTGALRHLTLDGALSDPVAGVPEVWARGQGGLLDVAIGPAFATDRRIYLTYAKPMGDGMSATAAARGVLSEDLRALSEVEDIFVQSPPSPTSKHYGSRIVFDDRGHAFITTGEHSSLEERDYAQDLGKTYGKVIRLRLDGSVPDDNPFVGDPDAAPEIWSYGHRNIQGAAIDASGKLWTIEHGPKGGDELNAPEAGENYGWPVVSYGRRYAGPLIGIGEASAEGMTQPVYFWDPVIAPGGMAVHSGEAFSKWNGDLLASGLVSGSVVRLAIGEDGLVEAEERLLTGIGRVRDVEVLEDGTFLVLIDADRGEVIHVKPAS